jgi:hypothetical protein
VAALMIGISLYCALRLTVAALRRGGIEWDVDCAHVLMGVAMVSMLIPGLGPFSSRIYMPLFALATVWFTWRLACQLYQRRDRPRHGGHVPHVAHSAAMLIMPAADGVAGHTHGGGRSLTAAMATLSGSGGPSTLVFAVALILVAMAVWDIDRLSLGEPGVHRTRAGGQVVSRRCLCSTILAPALSICCRIVIGITMAYMLIVMH